MALPDDGSSPEGNVERINGPSYVTRWVWNPTDVSKAFEFRDGRVDPTPLGPNDGAHIGTTFEGSREVVGACELTR